MLKHTKTDLRLLWFEDFDVSTLKAKEIWTVKSLAGLSIFGLYLVQAIIWFIHFFMLCIWTVKSLAGFFWYEMVPDMVVDRSLLNTMEEEFLGIPFNVVLHTGLIDWYLSLCFGLFPIVVPSGYHVKKSNAMLCFYWNYVFHCFYKQGSFI